VGVGGMRLLAGEWSGGGGFLVNGSVSGEDMHPLRRLGYIADESGFGLQPGKYI
jgi:hypothetical protein